jgi:hypothetical protein
MVRRATPPYPLRRLGALALADGDADAAERAYRSAVEAYAGGARTIGTAPGISPLASALHDHADVLRRLGRAEEARRDEERRQRIIALNPRSACPGRAGETA